MGVFPKETRALAGDSDAKFEPATSCSQSRALNRTALCPDWTPCLSTSCHRAITAKSCGCLTQPWVVKSQVSTPTRPRFSSLRAAQRRRRKDTPISQSRTVLPPRSASAVLAWSRANLRRDLQPARCSEHTQRGSVHTSWDSVLRTSNALLKTSRFSVEPRETRG